MKINLYSEFDTHVDTHACEKVRKSTVKCVYFVLHNQATKIPVKWLIQPSDGDCTMELGMGLEPTTCALRMRCSTN